MDDERSADAPTREEFEELKQQVQQLTPEKIGRRDTLKALGLGGAALANGGGVGAAGYQAATESAQAAEPDGDVGTSSNRVDLYGDLVDSNSVNIGEWGMGADYVIRNSGSNIVAFNTATQSDQFSSSELSGVLNNCLGELKDGAGEAQGRIYIAAGDYEYQFNVQLDNCGGISISGAGTRATKISQADNSDADLFVYTDTTQEEFFRLQDMTVLGNKANNTTGRMMNIDGKMADAQIVRVFASGFPDEGILTDYTWGWKLNNFVSEFHGGDGLYVTSNANRGLAAYGCKFNLNGGRGVRDLSTG